MVVSVGFFNRDFTIALFRSCVTYNASSEDALMMLVMMIGKRISRFSYSVVAIGSGSQALADVF